MTTAKGPSEFWNRGERQILADASGESLANLSHILHRRRRVSLQKAIKLEKASLRVLGRDRHIPFTVWLTAPITQHPAFFGSPLQQQVY